MRTVNLSPHENASSTVLVVDDEPHVRDLLSRWLRDEGYRATAADSSAAAWQATLAQPFDLITCDLHMPGGSGLDLLARIRQQAADTAFLMLTGRGATETAIESLTGGAYGYLTKPIERNEFLFHVRQSLERRQLILERRNYLECLERRVQEQTTAVRLAHEETIHRLLHATRYRDEETGAHVRRTGLFSEILARAAGWSTAETELIRMAAPMHDVGKIGIPDAILRKPGKLTTEEMDVMKQHTTIGAGMLEGSSAPVLKLAHDIALNHHERWDGTGYPHGIRGDAIPESARILAIVDVYDALTHDRVYRPAFPTLDAMEMMQRGQSTHFEPGLLGVFFSVLDEIDAVSRANPDESAEKANAGSPLSVLQPAVAGSIL